MDRQEDSNKNVLMFHNAGLCSTVHVLVAHRPRLEVHVDWSGPGAAAYGACPVKIVAAEYDRNLNRAWTCEDK